MVKIQVCILLAVIILYFMTLLAEKIREAGWEKDYKKAVSDYLEKLEEFVKLNEKISLFENGLNGLSERLTEFKTDFKTHDGLLENRLADIESVVKYWKDTMAGAGDSKKPHPKTKPKHLAEKGTET